MFDEHAYDEQAFDPGGVLIMVSITTDTVIPIARYRSRRPGPPREAEGILGLGGLRLTRRGRLVLILLALAAVAGIVMAGAVAFAGTPTVPVEVTLHTVVPGQTLWDFARDLAAPGQDLRDVVQHLRDVNGMSTSELAAGQVIAVPSS